jgi:hypothetical protein
MAETPRPKSSVQKGVDKATEAGQTSDTNRDTERPKPQPSNGE